jgi:hypothetical protein
MEKVQNFKNNNPAPSSKTFRDEYNSRIGETKIQLRTHKYRGFANLINDERERVRSMKLGEVERCAWRACKAVTT